MIYILSQVNHSDTCDIFTNTDNQITIDILSTSTGEVFVQVINTYGAILFDPKQHLTSGSNIIHVEDLKAATGMYYIQVVFNNRKFSKKVFLSQN